MDSAERDQNAICYLTKLLAELQQKIYSLVLLHAEHNEVPVLVQQPENKGNVELTESCQPGRVSVVLQGVEGGASTEWQGYSQSWVKTKTAILRTSRDIYVQAMQAFHDNVPCAICFRRPDHKLVPPLVEAQVIRDPRIRLCHCQMYFCRHPSLEMTSIWAKQEPLLKKALEHRHVHVLVSINLPYGWDATDGPTIEHFMHWLVCNSIRKNEFMLDVDLRCFMRNPLGGMVAANITRLERAIVGAAQTGGRHFARRIARYWMDEIVHDDFIDRSSYVSWQYRLDSLDRVFLGRGFETYRQCGNVVCKVTLDTPISENVVLVRGADGRWSTEKCNTNHGQAICNGQSFRIQGWADYQEISILEREKARGLATGEAP